MRGPASGLEVREHESRGVESQMSFASFFFEICTADSRQPKASRLIADLMISNRAAIEGRRIEGWSLSSLLLSFTTDTKAD